jgi:tRNA 2-thiouridine synthesizing protein A
VSGVPEEWEHEEVFDTLDRGCGEALLLLKLRLAKLPSGARLVIASRDSGAPIELPAWCRLTGHRLCEARPPFYLVEKRKE